MFNRLITNNVLVAFETMNHINQRGKGKEGLIVIKLNMSKAFDKVEWPYIVAIMRKLGFYERWIALIMMCISLASYSMILNGEPKGMIHPSWVLRMNFSHHMASFCWRRAPRQHYHGFWENLF